MLNLDVARYVYSFSIKVEIAEHSRVAVVEPEPWIVPTNLFENIDTYHGARVESEGRLRRDANVSLREPLWDRAKLEPVRGKYFSGFQDLGHDGRDRGVYLHLRSNFGHSREKMARQ